MIELRHLRYFVVAAEHGSFRKASLAIGIQESAVSRRIRDLEDHLGASLFQRHSGGVQLTNAGIRFLERARSALQIIDAGVRDVAAIGRSEEGRIKIGILSSLASGFLFNLLHAFDRDYPGVVVDMIEGGPTEHVAAVRQLQFDVAFVAGTTEWPGCRTEHLWSESVFAVLPAAHALCDRAILRWHDLAGESFIVSDAPPGPEIHDYLVQRVAQLGRHPDVHVQSVGRDVLLSMVAVGKGLTLTSAATTGVVVPGVAYRMIEGEVVPFCGVWSPRNDNPACRRLLSLARSMAKAVRAPSAPTAQCASPSQTRDPSP